LSETLEMTRATYDLGSDFGFPAEIQAEDAMTPPLAFPGKAINADHIVEHCFETAALEMEPIEGCWAVVRLTGEYLRRAHGRAGW
jgi:hypothetical protein